jgi:hypothetical protein
MIAGVATATIVESTRIMKKPSTMAQSAGHGFWAGPSDVVGPAGCTAVCGLALVGSSAVGRSMAMDTPLDPGLAAWSQVAHATAQPTRAY